mgnify:CR=1 FL=1
MKSRILKELHLLAVSPKDSPYYEELVLAFESEDGLRQRARTVLCDILHDYGAFAVSTIDRFFQQTLKAFSREIGQFATYQVELDRESLVSESVDRVLDSLSDDNKDLLEWLTQSVMDDLEKGKRYNLENNLKTVAMTLKSDEHRAAVEAYGIDEEKEYSKENLARMKKALAGVMASFVKEVKEAAKAFVSAAGEEGLANEDFSRKCFNSVYVCSLPHATHATKTSTLTAVIKRITCTFFYLRHKTFCFIICQRFKNASLPLILFSISE